MALAMALVKISSSGVNLGRPSREGGFKTSTPIRTLTCTSIPQQWGKGALKRNPGAVRDTQYESFKIDIKRRAYFDPRPMDRQRQLTLQEINDFVEELNNVNLVETLFQKHLSIKYQDEIYAADFLENVASLCEFFRQNLQIMPSKAKIMLRKNKDHRVYQFHETQGQTNSDMWLHLRGLHVTGTSAHFALQKHSKTAEMNFLRKHLWGLDPIDPEAIPAMNWGIQNESKALKSYKIERLKFDPTIKVKTNIGLLKSTDFPEGAASVDGICRSKIHPSRIVEAKCPYMLRHAKPQDFSEVLSKEQLSNFCLKWDNINGKIVLKKKIHITHKYNII
ncbi:hypothetical protein FOCC_FOCC007353 [Frankliniella occidentalis]|nr:hypothetical protein FOCC_FOCC007353 [Frankliniella occidentalis]